MAIGKRIVQRLAELKWERGDLLAAVPDLTPQALSNLIRRDSRRSEWDTTIAAALGVSVTWLVYGQESEYSSANVVALHTMEQPPLPPLIAELLDLASKTSERGQIELIGQARMLSNYYPAKANHSN